MLHRRCNDAPCNQTHFSTPFHFYFTTHAYAFSMQSLTLFLIHKVNEITKVYCTNILRCKGPSFTRRVPLSNLRFDALAPHTALLTPYRGADLMHNLRNEMVWRLCYIFDVTKKRNETGLRQPNGVEVPFGAQPLQLLSVQQSCKDSTTSGALPSL